jgi:ribosomal protein S8
MNDPIANMLTSLRNASLALVPQIQIPHSRLKEGIAYPQKGRLHPGVRR